jgi:RNA polymerase sigma-70 factor (ECF subfamily)
MSPEELRHFHAVYRETAPLVLRALRRLVRASEVDDAAQDVFVVVARRLREFDGRSKVSTWVYGIVLRVAADHRRARARRVRREEALAREPVLGEVETPERALERVEGRSRLACILDGMDDELRDVFVLVELEALAGPEVAAMLGLNPHTMHSRLRAARAQFEAIRIRLAAGSAP